MSYSIKSELNGLYVSDLFNTNHMQTFSASDPESEGFTWKTKKQAQAIADDLGNCVVVETEKIPPRPKGINQQIAAIEDEIEIFRAAEVDYFSEVMGSDEYQEHLTRIKTVLNLM